MGNLYTLKKGVATISDMKDGLSGTFGIGDGQVFYVDPGNGTAGASGSSPTDAFSTMQAGVDACVSGRGDVIMRLPGGEEVSTPVLFNKNGIYVKAVTYGVSPFASGELFSTYGAVALTDEPAAIVSARCTLDGLGFVSYDAGATFTDGAALRIGVEGLAGPFGTHITNCRFPKWGVANRIGISVEGTSDTLIDHCSFEGVGSALAIGIYAKGACENLTITDNHFRQVTFAVSFGDFAGGGPHLLLARNVTEDGKLLTATTAATGMVYDNWCEGATDTGSYGDTVDNYNTLGLVFSGQHYAE